MRACAFCDAKPQYRDRHTGQYVCLEHARLEVVAVRAAISHLRLAIRPRHRGRL